MKVVRIVVLIPILFLCLWSRDTLPDSLRITLTPLTPDIQHKKVSQVVTFILQKNHYKKIELDDSLSIEILERYLERLDPNRIYFLQSDIDSFSKHRLEIDDYLRAGHLAPVFEIFNVYQTRFAAWLKYAFLRLEQEFDFTKDEYLEIDREEASWATSELELEDLWRRRIKNDALNLKLADKDWDGIVKILHNRYKNIRNYFIKYQSEDIYQVFMNAFTESYDPHTNYFSPKTFDNFKIRMSRSFEGIGARLSTRNDYTIVVEIIPGGPADKSKALLPNDKIIGVAQGYDGNIVDVIGWRLDDVVQLIRGKKSTTVRLQILRANTSTDAVPDTIALIRDKITIEDQSARSDLINVWHEGKKFNFAVIEIPAFYSDFEARRKGEQEYKSTTRDVKNILQNIQSDSLDGVIIDLRGNGGGFLNEAVELTGLFIEKGPIVQVRNSKGKVSVEWDYDSDIPYRGPIAVLVDRLSASASEIFAAAIQDYNRGIIVGSQTFGKGTVQNAIDINRYLPQSPVKLGQLKLTIAKFYRINGGSTQNIGVLPDISFPSRYNLMDIGENLQKNALLWDKIDPLDYEYFNSNTDYIPNIEVRHNLRINADEQYGELVEELSKYQENRDKTLVSLQEERRRQEREEQKSRQDKDLSQSEDEDNQDSTQSETPTKEDLLVKECAHILGDYILLSLNKVNE
jgi:carboxyl-terminal processing protease